MAFNLILQFLLQTAAIAILWIVLQPIINLLAFDDIIWANAGVESIVRRDALYQYTIIVPAVAMGANIVWLYRVVQRKTVDDQDF